MGTKKKRKRKFNYYVVTVSDNPKQPAYSRRMTHGARRFWAAIIAIITVIIVLFVAITNYRGTVSAGREASYQATVESLQAEVARLNAENEALNDKITILSETVNKKTEVVEAIEERSLPTGFPLSVAADINEKSETVTVGGESVSRPLIEFIAGDGTYVVAAGDGVVSTVIEDATYGWEVRIDHGNGYVTSYRTNSEPIVKNGDELARGGLIFQMQSGDDEPAKLGYQMMLDDEYINPTDMLEING